MSDTQTTGRGLIWHFLSWTVAGMGGTLGYLFTRFVCARLFGW